MSKIVKLLIAVLVLGFLVGCGGGGGSSSPSGNNTNSTIIIADSNITLASISSGFPVFNDSNETIIVIYSAKDYYPVSASQVSTFVGALADEGFSGGEGYYYNSYSNYGVAVSSYPNEIVLELNSLTVAHTDALYTSVFPALDADVALVSIFKEYAGDLTAKFNAYRDLLEANGWTIIDTGNPWGAEKTIGSLTYHWQAGSSVSVSYSNWKISE